MKKLFKEGECTEFSSEIRRIALALGVVMMLMIVLSSAYFLLNISHSHDADDYGFDDNHPCSVCLQIQEICDVFNKFGAGVIALKLLVVFLFIAEALILTSALSLERAFSLISIKVRLNN